MELADLENSWYDNLPILLTYRLYMSMAEESGPQFHILVKAVSDGKNSVTRVFYSLFIFCEMTIYTFRYSIFVNHPLIK